MLRFLLILFLIYFIYLLVRIFIRRARYRAQDIKAQQKTELFDHIEDADFKDITDEPPDKQ